MNSKINFTLRRGGSISNQKGMTLILFVFLLGLFVTGVAIKFMSAGSYHIQRNVSTIQTIERAKSALIGNVLSGNFGTGVGQFPCAEDPAHIGLFTEGQALGNCSNSAVSIGRFAWRSMGTGPLVDSNGDKLWYALSPGFRSVPVNSDRIGTLSIDGVQNEAIALLFSPSVILPAQSRPLPTSSSPPLVASYLETENSDGDQDFITGPLSSDFNDRLVSIKADDVFPLIEKRILGEFKNYLNSYKQTWGAFPFPETFGDPTLVDFRGVAGESGGFLPVSNTTPTTTWNNTITPVPVIVSSGGNIVSAPACSFQNGNTRIRCNITISMYDALNPPTVSITGNLNYIGLGFYDGLDVNNSNDIRITTRSGSATVVSASKAITHSLNAMGHGVVTFSGILANTGVVRIEFRRTPSLSNWVLAATNHYLLGGSAGNYWHHLVYYKVASPFLPGGNGICGSDCLTVNAINVSPSFSLTNKHALLVSAGRKLNITNVRSSPTYSAANPAQVRSGNVLEDYFDSENNVSGGLVFDSTNLPLEKFNDQVLIVE